MLRLPWFSFSFAMTSSPVGFVFSIPLQSAQVRLRKRARLVNLGHLSNNGWTQSRFSLRQLFGAERARPISQPAGPVRNFLGPAVQRAECISPRYEIGDCLFVNAPVRDPWLRCAMLQLCESK